jgi:hypothetical protein
MTVILPTIFGIAAAAFVLCTALVFVGVFEFAKPGYERESAIWIICLSLVLVAASAGVMFAVAAVHPG